MKVTMIRKPANIEEVREGIYESEMEIGTIEKEMILDDDEFDALCSNFLTDNDIFQGDETIFRISNKGKSLTLLIDTQGFNYARYVAIVE